MGVSTWRHVAQRDTGRFVRLSEKSAGDTMTYSDQWLASANSYNNGRPYLASKWQQVQTVVGAVADGIPGDETAAKVGQWQAGHDLVEDGKVGTTTLYAMGLGFFTLYGNKSFGWNGKGSVCADGGPSAYHPENIGYDYLANAGWPGSGYGLSKDASGQPYVQGMDDPRPGYYVSTTAMNRSGFDPSDPRRFVDAERVPYIVLPKNLADLLPSEYRPSKGAVARISGPDRVSMAIYAEVGPAWKIGADSKHGEASIAALEAVGHDPWEYKSELWRAKMSASDISYQVWAGSNDRAEIIDGPRGQSLVVDGRRVGCP